MKKTIFVVSGIWLIIVGISFSWNYFNAKSEQKAVALQTASSFFEQVVITRTWNARHGGVYVPVTKDTKPNPYLVTPLRDIEIDQNLMLTLINPAFMTRQIAEIAKETKGIQFHLTSLRPIRPGNKPTAREESALRAFESGIEEISEFLNGKDGRHFFYMAPLKTGKECLKCHAKQGYREGDIRGGISITLPFVPKMPFMTLIFGHAAFGIVGLLGIVIFGLTLSKAYESIRRQAVMDALTGIPNRRNFSERILIEFNRSQRDKFPLSVIMCDVDNFKVYNDAFGHKEGDEALKNVAQVIEKTLKRPGDFCARYGGEEFVVILPNTILDGAREIAEKISVNVQKLEISNPKSVPWGIVTLSLGVSAIEANYSMTHEELIEKADAALYKAKEKGRNRVEVDSQA